MGFFKKLFESEDKPKCKHSIGDNWSTETYVWKGRDPTPYKHYTEYTCEKCKELVRIIYDDATMKYSDAVRNRY